MSQFRSAIVGGNAGTDDQCFPPALENLYDFHQWVFILA